MPHTIISRLLNKSYIKNIKKLHLFKTKRKGEKKENFLEKRKEKEKKEKRKNSSRMDH